MNYGGVKEIQGELHLLALIPFHPVEYVIIELARIDSLKTLIAFFHLGNGFIHKNRFFREGFCGLHGQQKE